MKYDKYLWLVPIYLTKIRDAKVYGYRYLFFYLKYKAYCIFTIGIYHFIKQKYKKEYIYQF